VEQSKSRLIVLLVCSIALLGYAIALLAAQQSRVPRLITKLRDKLTVSRRTGSCRGRSGMHRRIASSSHIGVGRTLIVLRRRLIAITRTLIMISPGLIGVTDRLIPVRESAIVLTPAAPLVGRAGLPV
jgi:hypothetical protein